MIKKEKKNYDIKTCKKKTNKPRNDMKRKINIGNK